MSFAIAGCAEIPAPLHDNPYQARAAALITHYDAAHGLHLAVPPVDIGAVTPLAYANDWCPSGICYLTLSSAWVARDPDYMMRVILPHELAHDVCVLTVRGCTPNDHGPAWQRIAVELGMPRTDGYVKDATIRAGGG